MVLVFFYEGTGSQIIVTLLVAFGFFAILMRFSPYKADDEDMLAAFAQVCTPCANEWLYKCRTT